jgi:hypothetical protein
LSGIPRRFISTQTARVRWRSIRYSSTSSGNRTGGLAIIIGSLYTIFCSTRSRAKKTPSGWTVFGFRRCRQSVRSNDRKAVKEEPLREPALNLAMSYIPANRDRAVITKTTRLPRPQSYSTVQRSIQVGGGMSLPAVPKTPPSTASGWLSLRRVPDPDRCCTDKSD